MMPSIMGFPLGPNTQAQKKSMPNYPTQYAKLSIDNSQQIRGDTRLRVETTDSGVWSAINQKKEKWFEK